MLASSREEDRWTYGPSSYDRRAAFFHCPESGGRKQSEDVGSKMQYCGTASTICGRYMLHSPTSWVEVTIRLLQRSEPGKRRDRVCCQGCWGRFIEGVLGTLSSPFTGEPKRFQVLLALARDALFVLQALLLHGTCKMLAMCMRVRSLLRGGDAAVPGVGLLPQVQHREAPRPLVPGPCTRIPTPSLLGMPR